MARRSRFVSLLLLLVVLVIAGAKYLQSRPVAPKAVVVERQVSGAASGVAPAPEFLLRHARELALSPAQQQQIQAIAAHYRRDIAPAQRELAKAEAQYRTYLAKPPEGARRTPQELTRNAGGLQRLSAVVATTRHSYWQRARAALDPRQRTQADRLAAQATLRDLS